MRTTQLKLIILVCLLGLALALALFIVGGAANLLAYFERGAEPASALNIVPNVPPNLHVALAWDADDPAVGRTMEPYVRSQIESAYIRAWLQWNLSYLKGRPHGLSTYFTGPALAETEAAVERITDAGLRVEQADLVHRLKLHFYSADGVMVAFSDQDTHVAQVIRQRAGGVVAAEESHADYAVVMLLEDGHWRIRHWVRRSTSERAATQAQAPCSDCVGLAGTALRRKGEPFQLTGINYYPQATPWAEFWPTYNTAVIDRDLTRIKALGLNTIRIFVPYEQFGGPSLEPIMLDRLADLLDRAQAQDLKVIVTLFDFRGDYSLLHWPDADRHLEGLLRRFARHPAILAWDLKNEPDLDDDLAGAPVIDTWLAHLIDQVHGYDPELLVTIGWSSPEAARRLARQVDLVQFHFYAPANEFAARYAALRAVAPNRPILLGEFGLPTWNSIWPHGHTEAEQARYYADLLTALRTTDSVGAMAWTLYDFAHVPAQVAGRWPWQTGPQRHMGLIRLDGSAKPAAALLAPNASLNVPAVPDWARWLKPFWLMLIGIAMATPALVWWGLLSLRRR